MLCRTSVLAALCYGCIVLAVLWLEISIADRNTKSYHGYRVIRAYPKDVAGRAWLTDMIGLADADKEHFFDGPNKKQDHSIQERKEPFVSAAEYVGDVSVWGDLEKQLTRRMPHLDLTIPRQNYRLLKRQLAGRGIRSRLLLPNLGRLLHSSKSDPDKCSQDMRQSRSLMDAAESKGFWACYQSADVLHGFMDELVKAYPSLASLQIIGKTSEGMDIKALKIDSGAGAKEIFWIDGGMHAREWISPAVATYIAHDLIKSYKDNKQVVDSFIWYIAPLLNVDGYEYSREQDRLWRKTRAKMNSASNCVGIDPNRNFNFKWMIGGSQDICSDVYAGPQPEVDPMVAALKNFILTLNSGGNLVAFYTLHSYGQLWGCPWGWTDKEVPGTFNQLMRVANAGAQAIQNVYGTTYDIGTTAQLGLIGGASDDWAFAVANVPFVYTIELRDKGVYKFALPPNQILPTAEETCAGVKASALEIKRILNENAFLMKPVAISTVAQNVTVQAIVGDYGR